MIEIYDIPTAAPNNLNEKLIKLNKDIYKETKLYI
jgi:hypothetical protein